jgi:hypothetical protein
LGYSLARISKMRRIRCLTGSRAMIKRSEIRHAYGDCRRTRRRHARSLVSTLT